MRSEKDQMTVAKDKSVVEIKFRDVPREADNAAGHPKQKEEKKEVFTKVSAVAHCLRGGKQRWRISAPRTATVASSAALSFPSQRV